LALEYKDKQLEEEYKKTQSMIANVNKNLQDIKGGVLSK
jgi:hypothetical protein